MLEDNEWREYFWTLLPNTTNENSCNESPQIPIATALLTTLSDLLFCPNFTISPIVNMVNIYLNFTIKKLNLFNENFF